MQKSHPICGLGFLYFSDSISKTARKGGFFTSALAQNLRSDGINEIEAFFKDFKKIKNIPKLRLRGRSPESFRS